MAFRRQPLSIYVSALILFALTALLPVVYMLAKFVAGILQQPSAVTSILIDTRQLTLLGRSVAIALSATLVALAMGLPVAITLAAKDLPFRKLFFFLVLIPVLIPSYVMAGAWIHLLSPTGLVNTVISGAFGSSAKLTVFSTMGCAWCLGISFFPIVAIIVATGLTELDSNLQDVARLYTNRWGVFWNSTLPQIVPNLLASICLVLIFVLAQYGVPSLLGVNTYPVEIFAQFSAFYNDTEAVGTALPLIMLVTFLILLQRRLMRSHEYIRVNPASETRDSTGSGRLRYYAAAFLTTLLIVTTVLPFSSVFLQAQGLDKILSTVASFRDSIVTTTILAFLAAVISTAIAFPIGKRLAHRRDRFTKTLDVVSWLPIAIPGTIIGLGLINMSNWAPNLQKMDSVGLVLLWAYVGMFSAFSIRIFEAAHRQTDPNISEAAAIDCRRWSQRLIHIDIRVHSQAIAASVIVVFVLALGELNATVLLIPPGRETLAISIDNLLHYGANTTASALCLVEAALVVIILLLAWFIWCVGRRQRQ